jgi:hypothetical protein
LETQDAELAELEQTRSRGRLNAEQTARYDQLKKMVADATWKVKRFRIGERSIGR